MGRESFRERDPYFDNYKAFLIVLVVIAHFLWPLEEVLPAAKYIRMAIYLFHMPAFAFVSGYFSKKNSVKRLIKSLLVPYLFLQMLFYVLSNWVWGIEQVFGFAEPGYTLWFLLALFIWRCIVNKAALVRGIVPAAFLAGILVGFDPAIGKTLALSRTIVFFPFFVMGYCLDKTLFRAFLDKRWVRRLAACLCAAFFASLLFYYEYIEFGILESCNSYELLGLPYGWLYRGLFYLAALFLTFVFAALMPRNWHWFSYMGQRTMGIYLTHGMICRTVQYCTDLYDYLVTPGGMIILIGLCILLCLMLSAGPVNNLVQRLSQLPVEHLLKQIT